MKGSTAAFGCTTFRLKNLRNSLSSTWPECCSSLVLALESTGARKYPWAAIFCKLKYIGLQHDSGLTIIKAMPWAGAFPPVTLLQIPGLDQVFHVRKDEAAEKAVAVPSCAPDCTVQPFQRRNLLHKDWPTILVLCKQCCLDCHLQSEQSHLYVSCHIHQQMAAELFSECEKPFELQTLQRQLPKELIC